MGGGREGGAGREKGRGDGRGRQGREWLEYNLVHVFAITLS